MAYPLCWTHLLPPPWTRSRGGWRMFVSVPHAERDEDKAKQARMALDWRRFRDPDFDRQRSHVHHAVPLFLGGPDDLWDDGHTVYGGASTYAVTGWLRRQPQMARPPGGLPLLPVDMYRHPPGVLYVFAGFKGQAGCPE